MICTLPAPGAQSRFRLTLIFVSLVFLEIDAVLGGTLSTCVIAAKDKAKQLETRNATMEICQHMTRLLTVLRV